MIRENVVSEDDVKKCTENYTRHLTDELDKSTTYKPEAYYYQKRWKNLQPASSSITTWDTGLDYSILHYVGLESVSYPQQFVN